MRQLGSRAGAPVRSLPVGALVATLSLPRLLDRMTPAAITLAALPVGAVLGIATSFATAWPLAAFGLLGWSVAHTMVAVNSISYRQQVTPEHLLSRVNTVGRMLAWGLGWTAGAAAASGLSSMLGVARTLHLVACVSLLTVAVAWTSPLVKGRD